MGRARALALYAAMSVPFGIAVHLGSEFAGLGRDADDVAFSPLHGYLALLAVLAIVVFLVAGGFFASRAERLRRMSLLAQSLPFEGRGPAFFALSAALQFSFSAITQFGEGCPLCHGDIIFGILAALVASCIGAVGMRALRTRLVSIIVEASMWLQRAAKAVRSLHVPRFERRHAASVCACFAPVFGNRPPPYSFV